MKIFSFRNILGVAAIGGAYAYARKHGGFKNAFDHLMKKKDELVSKGKEAVSSTADKPDMKTGYTSSNTYDRH